VLLGSVKHISSLEEMGLERGSMATFGLGRVDWASRRAGRTQVLLGSKKTYSEGNHHVCEHPACLKAVYIPCFLKKKKKNRSKN